MRKLVSVFFTFCFYYSGAQNLQPHDSVAGLYFSSQAETLPVHNGRVFYGYPGTKDDAFYPAIGWQKGSLLYEGVWYSDLSFMYDVYADELVTLHPNSTPIRLFTDRVREFSFNGKTFTRLEPDNDGVVRNAIYQRLVDGPLTIFVRRVKKIEENIVDMSIERKFITQDQFYAFKDGKYYPVMRQKSLLELVKDRKPAIMQHLKRQGLKFRKNREQAILAIAQFYNQSRPE